MNTRPRVETSRADQACHANVVDQLEAVGTLFR